MNMYNIARVVCAFSLRAALVALLSFNSLSCMLFESDDGCWGETIPCDKSFSVEMCDTTPGCRISNECRALWSYDPCSADRTLKAKSTCEAKAGCMWKPAIGSSDCISVAHECAKYNSYESCTGNRNCEWYAVCSGIAMDCSDIRDKETCNEVAGCIW